MNRWIAILALGIELLTPLTAHAQGLDWLKPRESKEPGWTVSVVGVHHYGRGHHIGEFSIDGRSCGNAGRPEKNSGSDTMCRVFLPEKWRPGIQFKVKWGVTNWNEELTALQKGNAGQWHEAVGEVERYSDHRGVEVHFWPDNSIRLVADPYGPPDEDTHPEQTPPLKELPVYPPDWYSLGILTAMEKHEVPMPAERARSLLRHRQEREAYYAFLDRLWTTRGLSQQQRQTLLAQEQDKERRGVRSGHLSYLIRLLQKQGMDSNAAFEAADAYRNATQEELDQHIAAQLRQIKNK